MVAKDETFMLYHPSINNGACIYRPFGILHADRDYLMLYQAGSRREMNKIYLKKSYHSAVGVEGGEWPGKSAATQDSLWDARPPSGG